MGERWYSSGAVVIASNSMLVSYFKYAVVIAVVIVQ